MKPISEHLSKALQDPLWIEHNIGDFYTMDIKPINGD